MRRTSLWIGLPIVNERNRRQLGRVCDLLFQHDEELYGLLVRPVSWFRRGRILLFSDVVAIRNDAVVKSNSSQLQELESLEAFRCMKEGKLAFQGRLLYTTEGNWVGEVADVYLEENSGKIAGYEISDGLLADLLYGRRYLKKEAVLQIDETLLIAGCPEPIPKTVHS